MIRGENLVLLGDLDMDKEAQVFFPRAVMLSFLSQSRKAILLLYDWVETGARVAFRPTQPQTDTVDMDTGRTWAGACSCTSKNRTDSCQTDIGRHLREHHLAHRALHCVKYHWSKLWHKRPLRSRRR